MSTTTSWLLIVSLLVLAGLLLVIRAELRRIRRDRRIKERLRRRYVPAAPFGRFQYWEADR